MPIIGFVDTSSPHNAKNHIRLAEMKTLWKAVRGGGKRTLAGRAPEEDDAGGTNRNEGRDVGPAPPQKRPCAR